MDGKVLDSFVSQRIERPLCLPWARCLIIHQGRDVVTVVQQNDHRDGCVWSGICTHTNAWSHVGDRDGEEVITVCTPEPALDFSRVYDRP